MRPALVIVLSVLLLAGCGSDDDAGSAASTTPTTSAPAPTLGPVPDIGTGPDAALLFLADVDGMIDLQITSCVVDLAAEPDGQVPAELLGVAAVGETEDGTTVNLDVRRFRSVGASPTITDTITIAFGDPDAPERALVAQRFEVDGLVSDIRDPDADAPLLVVGPGGFEGRGLFAAPGADVEDGGAVEGVVRGTCARDGDS